MKNEERLRLAKEKNEERLRLAEELIGKLLPCCHVINCERPPTYLRLKTLPVLEYYCETHTGAGFVNQHTLAGQDISLQELPYAALIRKWVELGGRFF